ncbi:hypothetical protein H2200_008868 [Cladophialophora chaetospira]|uniref:Aminoglycoside phosphotransferase domain-containing protein n=1 Tax=Cladophialophora chaetospira TaxID=386627 RepID=A0AA38X4W8_9EURO|nr:hypothetical protein H2200_008868 [Cladophialophora chaetospira]
MPPRLPWTGARPIAPALATFVLALAVGVVIAYHMGVSYFLVIINLCSSAPSSCDPDTLSKPIAHQQHEGETEHPYNGIALSSTLFKLSSTGSDEDNDFAAVKKAVNLEAIKAKAIEFRTKQLAALDSQDEMGDISCEINPEPMCGSYNLVYIIRWSDGVKWVARIPSIGLKYGPHNAAKTNSEYATMEYIRNHTSLPVPKVFCHSWNPDIAGVPFALLSFVEGKSLYQFWKEETSTTEEQKLEVLSAIAKYMAELSNLRFPRMGSLHYDQFKAALIVGPSIETIWDEEDKCDQPAFPRQHSTMKKQLTGWLDEVESSGLWEDDCDIPLMRMAVESIPDYLTADGQYTISLGDFDLQNIMVDNDGNITGFLDWDWVRIGPIAAGAVSYPMWITRDWQRGYGWGHDGLMADYPEDSPEQLSAYRRHYLKAMTACQGPGYDPRWTKLSHILARICQVAEFFGRSGEELCILLEYAKIPFSFKDYNDSFKAKGDMKEKDEIIQEAFRNMWDRYEEKPNQICKTHKIDDESDVDEGAKMKHSDENYLVKQDEEDTLVSDTEQVGEHQPTDHKVIGMGCAGGDEFTPMSVVSLPKDITGDALGGIDVVNVDV